MSVISLIRIHFLFLFSYLFSFTIKSLLLRSYCTNPTQPRYVSVQPLSLQCGITQYQIKAGGLNAVNKPWLLFILFTFGFQCLCDLQRPWTLSSQTGRLILQQKAPNKTVLPSQAKSTTQLFSTIYVARPNTRKPFQSSLSRSKTLN